VLRRINVRHAALSAEPAEMMGATALRHFLHWQTRSRYTANIQLPPMDLSVCLAGPVPNTDISGIESRLATYSQNVVLGEPSGWTRARSRD
jgi:hypothetical protein